MSRPGLWISSNFTNRTGFAWRAFFRSFRHIGDHTYRAGWEPVLSFANVEGEVDILSTQTGNKYFRYDPLNLSISEIANLRAALKRHRIKVAYLTDFPTWHWTYPLMRTWGVQRIVVHSHISVADPSPAKPSSGLRGLAKSFLHRLGWLTADQVLTCSEFVRHRLIVKARVQEDKVQVLHYGLPWCRFATTPYDLEGSGPVRICCAARAVVEKGIGHLIEAVALLAAWQELPPFEVRYAGTGPDLDAFQALAQELGVSDRFHFLGYVEDTTSLLAESDIVVIPTGWGDAFPYSVLEALAAGRPVIATSAGGVPEQIGPTGEAGILVPPGDSSALSTAMGELIKSPQQRQRLASNASRRASEMFREERYFEQLCEALDKTLHGLAS